MLGTELEGLAGAIALALPVLALVTVIMLAVRQIGRRRRGRKDAPLTGRYGEPVTQPGAQDALRPPGAAAPAAKPEESSASRGPAAAPVAPADIAKRIKEAEAKGAERDLTELYLALARDHVVSDRAGEARELLLKCIRLAARLGQKDVHARARLDLGDLCREQGDLTTACEHWQMARQLYFETKCTAPLAQAESRMRQNRCPTDWVLNDF